MKTPAQHLAKAEELLQVVDDGILDAKVANAAAMECVIRLAVAHMTMAVTINAVPLIGDLGEELTELREPRSPYRVERRQE